MKTSDIPNRKEVMGIGGGLLLMAIFTVMWATLAENGIQWKDNFVIIVLFSLISLIFMTNGIRLMTKATRIPASTVQQDKAEGKRIGKSFGIVFGAEIITIFIVSNLLSLLHLNNYIISAIALVVGIHFYPMAKIFRRKIDYYIASWACIIALTGIIITGATLWKQDTTFIFTGLGMALATTAYGIYMIWLGKIIKFTEP